jgi:hypothetical protein
VTLLVFHPCGFLNQHPISDRSSALPFVIPSAVEGSAVTLSQPQSNRKATTLTLSSRPERTRISYCAAPTIAACAAFLKENRMKFANAIKLDRKSGVAHKFSLLYIGSPKQEFC